MHPSSNLRICFYFININSKQSNLPTAEIPIYRILVLCLKKVPFKVVDSRLCDCSFAYQVK